jgi:hypothetical protein
MSKMSFAETATIKAAIFSVSNYLVKKQLIEHLFI